MTVIRKRESGANLSTLSYSIVPFKPVQTNKHKFHRQGYFSMASRSELWARRYSGPILSHIGKTCVQAFIDKLLKI